MGDERWERLARDDAEFYILTHDDDYSTREGRERFFASGRETVDQLFVEVGDRLPRRHAALELGCGVGRLAIPIADRFERVVAVDVAHAMLDGLVRNCREAGVVNVTPVPASGAWDREGPFDLVYSLLVFQHIKNWEAIADYVRRIAQCLAPDGVFYAHFDTRKPDFLYRVRPFVPSVILPARWRPGIRRVRRSASEVRAAFRAAGMQILEEFRPDSPDHVLIARRA